MKKQLVLGCLSLLLSNPIMATKHHKFSLKKLFSPPQASGEGGEFFTELKGSEEKKARHYFDQLKKRRKDSYERNQNKFGEKFTVSYEIALSASRLMEKHYDNENSFREGLQCFRNLTYHKNNLQELRNLREYCQSKLELFREQIEKEETEYEDNLSLKKVERLQNEISVSFPQNPEAVKFLSRSLTPEMDCYYHGATLSLSFFFGFTTSVHRLKCRSKLGRKVVYNVGSGNLGMGWGAIFTTKKAKFFKNEDGTFRRKTEPLSYAYLRQNRFHISDNNAMALGYGLSHNRRNIGKTTRDSQGGGIGLCQGYGFGGIVKDKKHQKADLKNQDHDFTKLFSILKIGE